MSARAGVAALVAVGDELTSGEQVDLNTSWLAERLGELGWRVERAVLVGDDQAALAALLRELAARAGLIVTTGGLGPTLDDVTRHAAADAAGVELVHDEAAAERIRAWFRAAGRVPSPTNDRQALFPAGATVIENPAGTAPGFRMELDGSALVVLPGPPRELHAIFESGVRPWLAGLAAGGEVVRVARFFLIGLPESDFAGEVGAWMERDANPRIGVRASGGVLKVKLEARGASPEAAELALVERAAAFRERFARWTFSEEDPSPAAALGRLLLARGVTFACAESCTGGLVAAELTGVAGISAVFREGFVTYSNEAKVARLGLPAALIEAHGAVSEEVAAAMARGAAAMAGARLAVGITGIAGPGGGSAEKPVGTVAFGVALDGQVHATTRRFPDRGREFVRRWAANAACELARRALLE
ncbi:MAG: competence/damage-inducible protein A [Planctomycetes bacterium]|nr:competence/damage-inducible protein A [Planctomycetota bacterium]